jgi:hypothetical protein
MGAILYPSKDFFHILGKNMRVYNSNHRQADWVFSLSLNDIPCILMNCPSLSAAPRILESFSTRRDTFAGVIIIDDWDTSSDEEVVRLRASLAAPYPSEAAKPP